MANDAASPQEAPEDGPTGPSAAPAWQPLTPRGVAAFARAPVSRLWLVQLLVALLVAGSLGWFLWSAWFPVIGQAIGRLPEAGDIRQQQLQLPPLPEPVLAQSRHLALVVDPAGQSAEGTGADLRVRFKSRSIELGSLLGYLELAYPRHYTIQFNQPELQPWWEAWRGFLLGSAMLGTVALLGVLWSALALLYGAGVWVAARLIRRELTPGGGVKLAGAALMPGALLMASGLALYGAGMLDLLRLLVIAALHVALGWVYLIGAVACLPPATATTKPPQNPFA